MKVSISILNLNTILEPKKGVGRIIVNDAKPSLKEQ